MWSRLVGFPDTSGLRLDHGGNSPGRIALLRRGLSAVPCCGEPEGGCTLRFWSWMWALGFDGPVGGWPGLGSVSTMPGGLMVRASQG
jgi:hypothetical protein